MVSSPPWGVTVGANHWSALAGRVASPPPSVSVIVAHYQQPRQLARTLAALARQSYAGELEVIVVDDGSDDPPSVPAGVQLVRQPRDGARRSAARNRGVRSSRGAVLCFLDADTTPERDYVTALTRLPALAPEAVTVGRRRHADFAAAAIDADVATAGPAGELPSPRWLADGYRASGDLHHAGPRAFRFVISAVLACTRWFFDEVGGFDESFDAYGGEDWEWAHRAWLGGAIFAHVPAAVAWHDGPAWEGRASPAARDEKNAEAVRLAALITAPGHRSRGLLGRRAETLIAFETALDPDATFICVDSLLAALPRSAVRLPTDLASGYADDPRVLSPAQHASARTACPALYLTVHAGVTVDGPGLSRLGQAMLDRDDGCWRLGDEHGPLLSLENARYRARVGRWGAAPGFPVREDRPAWLERLSAPADVEAYLGGWRR